AGAWGAGWRPPTPKPAEQSRWRTGFAWPYRGPWPGAWGRSKARRGCWRGPAASALRPLWRSWKKDKSNPPGRPGRQSGPAGGGDWAAIHARQRAQFADEPGVRLPSRRGPAAPVAAGALPPTPSTVSAARRPHD